MKLFRKSHKYLTILCLITLLSCSKIGYKSRCCSESVKEYKSMNATDTVTVFMATAFSPNGDGINDVFIPVGKGFTSFSVKIYSGTRLIYKINESLIPSKDKLKEGAFKYKVSITSFDGKNIELEGKVCVLGLKKPTSYENICSTCIYPDMIDPFWGVIYNSQETFCNP